ncbi:MAG: endo-1,4-beta-xylanase [Candidatus Solibacter sp.]
MKLRISLVLALAWTLSAADFLKDAAAKRGIRVGAAVQSGYIANEPAYATVLNREFSMVEPEYEMLWSAIQFSRGGAYRFDGADRIVDYAARNNMLLRADHMVWHSSLPSWLTGGNFSAAELNQILHDHIFALAGHFKGKVYSWEVVNEAVADGGAGLRNSIWNNQPGIGLSGIAWIEQAFRWAHEADPDALLFYNDYNTDDLSTKSNYVYNMVKQMLDDGVPIHGVGLQMHLTNNINYPNAAGLEANIKRLTDLGLQVIITEMDVRLPVNSAGDASASDLAIQSQLYGRVVSACLKFGLCKGIQTWGISDKHSWIPGVFPGTGAGLPFDTNYQPKGAYSAMLNPLVNTPATISASNLLNAANYTGSGVAPGEIVVLFDARFGPANLATLQLDSSSGKITSSLAATQLLFDGVAAPVIYAQSGQASFIVPFSVANKPATTVQYVYQGAFSNSVQVPVLDTAPGLFSIDSSGTGPGAILNQDFTLNSAANPAQANDVVLLFGTGAGLLIPASPDGALVGDTPPKPVANVTVQIGGKTATVRYAGGAPGLTNALLQVNVQVPAGLAPGPQSVSLKIGSATAAAGITVAVK